MADHYLLLTPVLMFLVVALVGFVGCEFEHGVAGVAVEGPAYLVVIARDGSVDLRWDPVTDATEYTVKHGVISGDYPTVQPGVTDTSFTVSGLENGTTYFFVVTATVNGAETDPSQELSAIPGISFVVTPTPGTPLQAFDGWGGIGFHTAAKLRVHRLGRFFAGNKVLHPVKIVDAGSFADVPGGTCVLTFQTIADDGFCYCDLTPAVTLLADKDYFVVCREFPGEAYYDAGTTKVTITSAAVREYPVYGDNAGSYVVSTAYGNAYGPVNFIYSLAPA